MTKNRLKTTLLASSLSIVGGITIGCIPLIIDHIEIAQPHLTNGSISRRFDDKLDTKSSNQNIQVNLVS